MRRKCRIWIKDLASLGDDFWRLLGIIDRYNVGELVERYISQNMSKIIDKDDSELGRDDSMILSKYCE